MTLLSTANLTNLAIAVISSSPVGNGDFEGEMRLEISDRRILWIWNSTTVSWDVFLGGAITGTGSPQGSVAPNAIGQIFVDTTGNNVYISTGLTNTDWKGI